MKKPTCKKVKVSISVVGAEYIESGTYVGGEESHYNAFRDQDVDRFIIMSEADWYLIRTMLADSVEFDVK